MKRLIKIFGFLFFGAIGFLVIATVAIKIYLTPEKIKTLIENEANAQLHRQVKLGSISVGLIRGLQISNFKLSESPDFSKGTFISSEKFVLNIRLLPLLFKKIMVSRLDLVKPEVTVLRASNGKTFNFSDLMGAGSTASSSPSKGSPSPYTVLVTRAGIKSGSLKFIDQSPEQQSVSINDLNLKLQNFSLTSPMDLQTSFSIKKKNYQGNFNFEGVVNLAGDAKIKSCTIASGPSKLSLEGEIKGLMSDWSPFDLKLALGTIAINANGAVKNARNPDRSIEVRLNTNEFPLAELAHLVPVAAPPKDVTLTGNIQLNADLNGTAEAGQLGFKVDGHSLEVGYGDSFKKPMGVPLAIEGSGHYSPSTLFDFKSLQLSLGRMALSGVGHYGANAKKDDYSFNFQSNSFPLEDVAGMVPSLRDYRLSGKGVLKTKLASTAKGPDVSGDLALSNTSLHYQETALTQIVTTLHFTMDSVAMPRLTGLLNGSDLKSSLNIRNLNTHPLITADVEAAVLELNKLIPKETPAQKTPKKAEAGGGLFPEAWAAQSGPGLMDRPMDFSGRLRAGQIKHEYMTGENMDLKWNLTDVTKELSRVNGSARLRQGNGEFKNIQKLTASSAVARVLLMPITLLQKVSKVSHGALKLPSLDNFRYKEIVGDYDFKSGTMNVSRFAINGTDLNASMTGTVGLAGQQPLHLKATLKTTIAGSPLTSLDFNVGGTILDPKISLDAAAATINVFKNSGVPNQLLKKIGLPSLGESQKTQTETAPADGSNTKQAAPAESKPQQESNPKEEQIKQIEGILKGILKR